MSDENMGQEQKPTTIFEMAATPFGGSAENAGEKVEQAVPAEAEEQTAAEPASTPAEQPAEEEEPMTMEAAMAGSGVDYSGTFKSLSVGDVVDGVVVHIDREGVLVDVGTKSEGTIKPHELSSDPSANPEDVVSVGEKIRVYVVQPHGQEGGPVLSKKRADFEKAWERLEKAYEDGEVLKAMVTDRVKGGLVVDLGIRGFVPASHLGSGKLKNLEKFVGQSMPFKVIEVDRERRKVVLSNRLATEEERDKLRGETLESLKEGQIREGVVRRITDYGAFIDLGGVDGLLHVSEMSWTRINHPSEVVKVGQKLQVMVLKLNLDKDRVSLGLRQILPDPWGEVRRLYSVGDVIKGNVSRLVPFGAFVQVSHGVEGIVPNSELAIKRVNRPEDVVSVGQEVEVKVIDLRPDERRMTLSIRQLLPQPERVREEPEYKSYSQSSTESKTTIGDLIGSQLGELASSMTEEEEKPAKKASKPRASKKKVAEEAEAEVIEETAVIAEEAPVAEVEEAPAEKAPVAEVEEAPAEETVETVTEEVVAEAEPEAEAEAAPEAPAEAEETEEK